MSKEQTPITAEARLKELGLIKKGYSHFIIERGNECFELVEIMERYAKAKVLEALESFIDWCDAEDEHYKSKEELINAFLKQK